MWSYMGVGGIQVCGCMCLKGYAANEWNTNFLYDAAQPHCVIIVPNNRHGRVSLQGEKATLVSHFKPLLYFQMNILNNNHLHMHMWFKRRNQCIFVCEVTSDRADYLGL